MKITNSNWNNCIDFSENPIVNLIIENKKYYRSVTDDIINALNKEETDFILSDNGKIEVFNKHIHMLSELLNFDINKRTLINKIAGKLEDLSNEDIMLRNKNIEMLNTYIDDLLFALDLPIIRNDDVSLKDIIKASGLSFEKTDSLCENILNYMEVINSITEISIFITFNLTKILEVNEYKELMYNIYLKNYCLLNMESGKIEEEYISQNDNIFNFFIDNDLCEI